MASLSYPHETAGIRLLFSFRKSKQTKALPKEKRQQVLISVSVNEVPARSRHGSKVYGRPDQWNQQAQCFFGTSEEVRLLNRQLQVVHDRHLRILLEQTQEGNYTPTAETVRAAFIAKPVLLPDLLEAYQLYIDCLREVEQRKPATLLHWQIGKQHLKRFLIHSRRTTTMPLGLVTIRWAKDFMEYLLSLRVGQGQPRMKRDTASHYTKNLVAVLNYMIELGHLELNPLVSLKIRRGAQKEVYFLDDAHLDRLAHLPLTGKLMSLRDLALLACYTGLDLPDLYAVIRAPQAYLVTMLGGGQKLIIRRAKTGVEAQIPLLPGVVELLGRFGTNQELPQLKTVNRGLKKLQAAIGFAQPLSCKILRKTAGSLFLNAGYSVEVVQQLLGHSSVKITQRHYARIYDKRVDAEMSRVGMFAVPLSQPRHSA